MLAAATMMAYSGDGTARADDGDGMAWGRRKRTGTQGAKPCWWESIGEETGRTVAGDERVDGRSRAREEGLTSGAGPSERERVRGKGLERLTCGAGWQWVGCGREREVGRARPRAGETRARER
jgi:hypothetical protein